MSAEPADAEGGLYLRCLPQIGFRLTLIILCALVAVFLGNKVIDMQCANKRLPKEVYDGQ